LQEIPGSGKLAFEDGLEYEEKGWKYCAGQDRRFRSEMAASCDIKAAGLLDHVNTPPAQRVPLDCFDCGDGYYDPSDKTVYSYETDEKGGKIELREPEPEEIEFATTKGRLGSVV
jgi:hypothetical protein